jgi:CRISPR/Cas system-associated exonuclease Cas4 (RecB family)
MGEDFPLSVTQLRMYLRCPLQYFFRYACGLKAPPDGGLVLGRAVHSALRENYRQKMGSREDLPVSDLTDVFSDRWEREIQEAEFRPDEKPGELKDQGVGLLRLYREKVAPKVQPLEVEERFLIEPDGIRRPITGYIDLIDDQGFIIDHKTSKRSYPADSAEKDLQLTAYAMAYRSVYNQNEKGVRMDVMVRSKKPKIQQLEGTRSQADIDRFLRLAKHVEHSIDAEIYYPNENYTCGICGYADMCKEW